MRLGYWGFVNCISGIARNFKSLSSVLINHADFVIRSMRLMPFERDQNPRGALFWWIRTEIVIGYLLELCSFYRMLHILLRIACFDKGEVMDQSLQNCGCFDSKVSLRIAKLLNTFKDIFLCYHSEYFICHHKYQHKL
jgi:hypothetical protein